VTSDDNSLSLLLVDEHVEFTCSRVVRSSDLSETKIRSRSRGRLTAKKHIAVVSKFIEDLIWCWEVGPHRDIGEVLAELNMCGCSYSALNLH